MKKKAILAIFSLFLLIVAIGVGAKSEDTKIEDKSALEKEILEKDTMRISKGPISGDMKTKSQTKTGDKTQDFSKTKPWKKILKIFSKNDETSKTTISSSADAKSHVTKTEDKSAFEKGQKEFPEEDTSPISKDRTKTKWKVTDEGKLKIDGKANSVCINLPEQTLTVGDTGAAQAIQYEFRSGMVKCEGTGFFFTQTENDPAVEVVECSTVELKAKCREGFVLNYGGSCGYGNDVDITHRGIEKLYAIPDFFGGGWGDLPSSREVMIRCNTKLDISGVFQGEAPKPIGMEKTVYITCVKEKT